MPPAGVWHSLVSTFWRYSLSRSDSDNSDTGSFPGEMTALDSILDDLPLAEAPSASGEAVASENHEQALYEEHAARVQAEAEASAAQRRFLVASQQMAEYLSQKAEDVRAAAGEAAGLAEAAGAGAAGAELAPRCSGLHAMLESTAADLGTTAGHFRAECEATKRSLSQADLVGQGDQSNGSKRLREASDDATQEEMGGDSKEPEQEPQSDADAEPSPPSPLAHLTLHDTFRERARYIPLRLDSEERRLLRLLEAALSVSEYTDRVDVLSWRSKSARVHAQVKDICAVLCGLVVAQDFKRGQKLIAHRDFASLATFFQDCFEVGRRHKIMNPEKMRDTYGKLMYMLMDASEPEIQELLEFSCIRPLRTVHTLLEGADALALLDDPLLETATAEIHAAGLPRHEIQRRIKNKERARDVLARRFRSSRLSEEDILRCLYSISDNNTYLLFNRDPVDKMIEFLKANFSPKVAGPGTSLAIQGGAQGARLTHSHERQYAYVLQSLTLWREISHEMFKLWSMADSDMLDESNYYRLQNTGQGLQRVQSASRVSRAMHAVLARCQRRLGSWVGSSVVHLGDHNVPNALIFIDKYTQVPRILGPLVLILERLPSLCRDPNILKYVESLFGSVAACRATILQDFYRHAFDGSGADNFFDAGSCIDGRLTSAWNWCSKLEKKAYCHVFSLAGFTSFDGEFK